MMLTTTGTTLALLLLPWTLCTYPVSESSSCNPGLSGYSDSSTQPCPRVITRRPTTTSSTKKVSAAERRTTTRSGSEIVPPPLPRLWSEDTDSKELFWLERKEGPLPQYPRGKLAPQRLLLLLLWLLINSFTMPNSQNLCCILLLLLGYPPETRSFLFRPENSLLRCGKSMICLLRGSRRTLRLTEWEAARKPSEAEKKLPACLDRACCGHLCQIHHTVLFQR